VTGSLSAIAEISDQADRPVLLPPDASPASLAPEELAALTHDLRSPLMAIQGFAEFIILSGDEMSTEQRAGYLADIGTASRRMQAIIDQILERAAPASTKIAILPIIGAAARLHQARADALGAVLVIADSDLDLAIKADPDLLHRILDNLIGNALSHGVSEAGTVRIEATADRGELWIAVSDDGPGMTETALAAALSPFGAPQPEGRVGGLGLPNCASMAEAIGARLEIITSPGNGLSARLIFSPA